MPCFKGRLSGVRQCGPLRLLGSFSRSEQSSSYVGIRKLTGSEVMSGGGSCLDSQRKVSSE
jgi:hypothetical protein